MSLKLAVKGERWIIFMLSTAYREAEKVLFDKRVFAFSDEEISDFIKRLDATPQDNPKSTALLSYKTPWEA